MFGGQDAASFAEDTGHAAIIPGLRDGAARQRLIDERRCVERGDSDLGAKGDDASVGVAEGGRQRVGGKPRSAMRLAMRDGGRAGSHWDAGPSRRRSEDATEKS